MAKPTPGVPYTIVSGDNLYNIAGVAYGIPSRWPEIWKANQTKLRSGDPNLIFPGEVIRIPVLKELKMEKPDLPGKEYDDLTIVIDDKEFHFDTASIFRSMDTCADGFTITTSDSQALKPFRYNEAQAYVGGQLVITGRIYTVSPLGVGKGIEINGFSTTVDLVDSNLKAKYEANNVDLKQIAEEIVEDRVVFDAPVGGTFKRVTAEPGETKFDYLARLARQRKLLVTSTSKGELLLTQADTKTKVGSLVEGFPPLGDLTARFDGRERFGSYKVIRQARGKAKSAVSVDNRVPLSRFKTINIDDAQAGPLQDIADWQRSKQVADALTIPVPVSGHYAPDGSLWRENTILNLESETLYVPDGFEFSIRSAEYLLDEEGHRSVLNLIPPQVFTGEEIVEPWF